MAIHVGTYAIPLGHVRALENYMRPHSGDWHVVNAVPEEGRYALQGDIDETRAAIVNVTLDIAPLLDKNAEMLNASNGRRWGDGQLVARIPLGLRYHPDALKGLGQALNVGDEKYVNKVLNDSEFSKLRTFGGRL